MMALGRCWMLRFFDQTYSMSINWPMSPKSMRAFISIRVLLHMVCTHSRTSVPLKSVIEWTRMAVRLGDWSGGFGGMAFSVLSSVTGDCGSNKSFVYPTVLVSNTKNLLVKWGVGFTIDLPENAPLPSLTPWLAQWQCPLHPLLPQWPQP